MNAGEALRAASREIQANKTRSALSFAAVAVGVASLLYTFAQTRGMQQRLSKNLVLMGPGRLSIERQRNYVSKGRSRGLTYRDADAIRRAMPDLYMVAPKVTDWGTRMVSGSFSGYAWVLGTEPEWRKRDWVYGLRGRFIDDYDVATNAHVCVIIIPGGWHKKPFWAGFWKNNRADAYADYVRHHDLLGGEVRLAGTYFKVVGVLQSPPRDLDPRWQTWDAPHIVVPVTTFLLRVRPDGGKPDGIDEIVIDTGDAATLGRRRHDIEQLMRERHRGEQDFEITDLQQAIESELQDQRKQVKTALALGLVALLAGGIGIMNVTLAAIFSRVKEIGVRRALGATPADIMAQFLLEAALLGVSGGVAGVGLGLVGVHFLQEISDRPTFIQIAWSHCAAVIAIGALISAAFAAAPAWQASRLDPVEALKSE